MRNALKISLWVLSFSVLALFLADFCHDKTKGFQRGRIAPSFSPPAAVHSYSVLPHQELLPILKETFTYLKKGRSSYVFISEDQKYVLKFLRNPTISAPWWISCTLSQKLFPSFCQKQLMQKQKRKQQQESSYELAFHKLPQQTAILCLHLHSSSSLRGHFTLRDAIGIQHNIPMDATAFILQKKAEPFCSYFQKLYDKMESDKIKNLIQQFATLLKERADVGIRDHDLSPRYNLGIIEDTLVTFDLDSLVMNELNPTPEEKNKYMRQDAKKMLIYLKSVSPDLELLLQEEIEKFSFLF